MLVAPLDWGLGHTTRCIPIINELLAQGFEVVIAAETDAAVLLKKEFLNIKILRLKGYRIKYAKNKAAFWAKIILQIPKIIVAIKREKKWLEKVIDEHKIDIVIADNRFGLYSKKAHCIFITHQLHIKTGNGVTEKIAQLINYQHINKFNECWVIDEEKENNFAGELSHPHKMPLIPTKYIGALSRFKKYTVEKKYDVVAVLSGPEPQRSIFENILLGQMQYLKIKIALVRGLPNAENILNAGNIKIYNHLPAEELNELMLASKIIIARSGYTTVMDIAALQQKAIFVPTPAQSEQEYLAQYLSNKKYCSFASQISFNIEKDIAKIESFALAPYPACTQSLLKGIIATLQ